MVVSRDELIAQFNALHDGDTSDAVLSFLENLSDSVSEKDGKMVEKEWQEKYDALDTSWRQKYKDRFSGVVDDESRTVESLIDESTREDQKLEYSDLFKEGSEE